MSMEVECYYAAVVEYGGCIVADNSAGSTTVVTEMAAVGYV